MSDQETTGHTGRSGALGSQPASAITQADQAELFRALHNGPEPLLLPNPWDVGSAKLLAWLGPPVSCASRAATAS